jgi:hypothetical protein
LQGHSGSPLTAATELQKVTKLNIQIDVKNIERFYL